MKIAIVSDDQVNISHHFGKAHGFVVCSIEDNKVTGKEYRENIGKNTGQCGSCNHAAMINNVKDCDVVISYGMGHGIYADLLDKGIKPIVTDENTIDEALGRFLEGHLKDNVEKLH